MAAVCLSPRKSPQTIPWLFVPWPLLSSPLSATHCQGPIAGLIALAVSHVVQNSSKPIVSQTPPGLSLCSRPSHRPIAHSLTPTAGFNFVHTAVLSSHRNVLTASAVLHVSAMPSDFPRQTLTVSSPPQVLLCAHRLRVVPFPIGSSPPPGFIFFQCSPSLPTAQGLIPPPCFTFCTTPSHCALAKSVLASARFPFVRNALASSSSQLSHRCHSFTLCATLSQRPIDKCLIAVAGFHFVRIAIHASQSQKSQSHRRLPLGVQLPPTVSSPIGSRPPPVSPLCTTTLSCLPIANNPISTVVFHFSSKLPHTPIAQGLISTAWFNFDLYSVPLSHSK